MTHIASVSATPWVLPLAIPFKIATRTATEARNVRVSIVTENGIVGVGAAAPVPYVTGETDETVIRDIQSATSSLVGLSASNLYEAMRAAFVALEKSPSARASIEMALYDIAGKLARENNWRRFGAQRKTLETDLTIPFVAAGDAQALVRDAAVEGFNCFKVKVGDPEGHDADLERIRSIVTAAPSARLRIDANQAFTPDGCISFVAKLLRITSNVELIEQPVEKSDTAGLRYVRDRITLPVFADEAAQTADDVRRLIAANAVDGINIKLMKSGLQGALEIIEICRASGIKMMIGCMLESRLGLTAALYIAAGTGAIELVDLDAHRLVASTSATHGGFTDHGPTMTVDESEAGWGAEDRLI